MLLSKMRSTRWVRASGSGSGPLHHTHPHPSFVRYTRSFDAYEIRGFTSTIFTWGRAPDSLLGLRSLNTESEHSLARAWLEEFGVGDIPKEAWSAGYTRSSGPGGQHVNKTNSKATVRCDLAQSGTWLPPFILGPLSKSAYYVKDPPSLLISSQSTRTASSNLASALGILHSTLKTAGQSVLVGQTSPEQKNKVKNLIRAEKGRVRGEKERRSTKKSARKDFG